MNRLFRTNFPIRKLLGNKERKYTFELRAWAPTGRDFASQRLQKYLPCIPWNSALIVFTAIWLLLYTSHKEQIRMYALSKLNKQHEQTWVNLQKRLNEVQFSYGNFFSMYLLACNHAGVQTLMHDQPLNIYTIFVGYPGTGMFNRLTAGGLSIMTDTCKTL